MKHRPLSTATLALLAVNLLLNLAASICFKEGGTNAAHRWHYFIGGNVLGISATVFMMGIYQRMNANLAMVLVTAGSGLLVQFAFWALYRSPLTGLQWAGIALTVAGSILATWSGATPEPPPVTVQPTRTEAA
ncbi:MAG: hypothetical protein WCI17_01045 [bacterium]